MMCTMAMSEKRSNDSQSYWKARVRLEHLGRSVIHSLCQQGRIKALEYLHTTSKGLTINSPGQNGDTPLHLSASEGQEDVVEWLIHHGANVHAINRVLVYLESNNSLLGWGDTSTSCLCMWLLEYCHPLNSTWI